jgi:PPOX class probable F420-dependent enzyme
VDIDEARSFLGGNHRSVLITRRAAGGVQASPVVHAVSDDGRIWVSSRETAYKVRNLRRDPAVTLCAFTDGFFGPWTQVDGRAEIVSLPEAMDVLVTYYRKVSGEHPDWDEYRAAMRSEKRCVIVITPERAGPDRRG